MQNLVYEPAEDSELLLDAALKEIKEFDEVIEVGAGSGFVAEKIAKKCKYLITTEINPFAAEILRSKGLDVVVTDVAKGIKKKFTLALFNPPYLELEKELKRGDFLDLAIDGGKHGIKVISKFLDQLKDFLHEDGRAIFISSSQNEPYVFDLIKEKGYSFRVIAERNLFFEKIYAILVFSKAKTF
ncbi:MAG: methyltransferase [Archaeoglobaceae archaeon]|nr:methyltransferase [Archaeoglobaceae archaeon]MDW8013950.1 protein methyltransferase [Archaeoglobaceae archaeon]